MPELELKERLAQEIFLNMMKEAGKQISRIDYSNQIQKIIEDKTDLNIKNVIKDINFHKHDFLLQSRNGILLVNLYYLENGIKSLELEKGIGNAILIIVTNKEPFFEIAYVN
ncbi:MAG: hypothetical protein U9Q69_01070, partial [Nanoarchaeota archaeon]|nr:hypothetical protein [Nanoarchaeota archaeon]